MIMLKINDSLFLNLDQLSSVNSPNKKNGLAVVKMSNGDSIRIDTEQFKIIINALYGSRAEVVLDGLQ